MTETHRFSAGENLNKVFSDNAHKKAVFIPKGRYSTGPVRIPSGSHVIFEDGAVLDFTPDFASFPPVQTRWEGVNCWAMHPCFFIDHAEDVVVEGHGVLEGNGQVWWNYIREWKKGLRPNCPTTDIEKKFAELNPEYTKQPGGGGGRPTQFLRPPLLQILDSKNIVVDGLTLVNSPFWTFHTVNSHDIEIRNVLINNPSDSPNTDGIDIESCVGVKVVGCDLNVGDDGIAVKCGSGKEMMNQQRSENIEVHGCTVRSSHGGFVIGSETASGVAHVNVSDCSFLGTDRGIRIKTRRDRGGVIEDIHVSNIHMEGLICPVSINEYYRCGQNDQSLYSLKPMPITPVTPVIKDVFIEGIHATGCRGGAALFVGLPELPLSNINLSDSTFEMSDKVEKGLEIEMCAGIPESDYRGIRIINADVRMNNIKVNVEPDHVVESY
jgi:polygalacturonase